MARDPAEVLQFLRRLARLRRPAAQREFAELESFAGTPLAAWDVAFYAERLKRERLAVSEEELRPYFPLPRVLEGLFAVAQRLYGIRVEPRADVEVYHPDVQFYDVVGADGAPRGGFFLDLYARPKKRGGAWMDECLGRIDLGGAQALPVAYLVCNFTPPGGRAAVAADPLRGGDAVPRVRPRPAPHADARRLPERRRHQRRAVGRGRTAEPVHGELRLARGSAAADLRPCRDAASRCRPGSCAKLQATRTFQAGMQSVRQLEFALFDFRLHAEFDPERGARLLETLAEVRAEVAVVTPPAFNRFPHSFQHIFSGGYAAGYYSYKWAEVLSADAFGAFEDAGIFDTATARRFLGAILERGGSRDAMEAFVEFRGRPPELEPLLRQLGLAA